MAVITEPGWHVLDEGLARTPESGVAADFDLLEAVATGASPPVIRLWENRQCLVVSGKDSRQPGFDEAQRQMAKDGWPVIVRGSGGSAVPHGPGILLLSMIHARPAKSVGSIDEGYDALCGWMGAALKGLGIETSHRSVPNAFCDGRYNLAVGAQKIAGTAQRWRKRTVDGISRHAVLAHALLLVEGAPAEMTAAVNRFYELAGGEQQFEAGAVTTLSACLEESADLMPKVRTALIDAAAKTSIPH